MWRIATNCLLCSSSVNGICPLCKTWPDEIAHFFCGECTFARILWKEYEWKVMTPLDLKYGSFQLDLISFISNPLCFFLDKEEQNKFTLFWCFSALQLVEGEIAVFSGTNIDLFSFLEKKLLLIAVSTYIAICNWTNMLKPLRKNKRINILSPTVAGKLTDDLNNEVCIFNGVAWKKILLFRCCLLLRWHCTLLVWEKECLLPQFGQKWKQSL